MLQQVCLLVPDQAERAPNVPFIHLNSPYQLRLAVRPGQVDLGFPVPENMDVSRFMVGLDMDRSLLRSIAAAC
jgi:hypothetical protein